MYMQESWVQRSRAGKYNKYYSLHMFLHYYWGVGFSLHEAIAVQAKASAPPFELYIANTYWAIINKYGRLDKYTYL